MKSRCALAKLEKICKTCNNKFNMIQFGSTKDTCSDCFELEKTKSTLSEVNDED